MLSSSWNGFFKRAIVENGMHEGHAPPNDSPPTKRVRMDDIKPSGQDAQELGLMKRDMGRGSATFIGSSSGIHFVQSVYRALEPKIGKNAASSDRTHKAEKSSSVPGEDDEFSLPSDSTASRRLWRAEEIGNPLGQKRPLDFETLLVWSGSYWDIWHPVFPFLYAPEVLGWLRKIANADAGNPLQHLDPFKIAIVRAIFSISLADRRQDRSPLLGDPVPSVLTFDTTDHAIASIHSALAERPSMEGLQAVLSVQLFLVSMLRQSAASRIGGLITRIVYQLGLHRCPTRYATFGGQEAGMRKRLLWSVYCLDRHISQSLGSPLGIRDDDLDVCRLDQERHGDNSAPSTTIDERLALLNLTARIFEIKGQILEFCNKSINHRPLDPDQAILLSSKIAQVSNATDDFLESNRQQDQLSGLHIAALRVLVQECIISLNRPLLAHPKHETSYKVGLQVCVGASRTIINTLHEHQQRFASGKLTTPLLWPTFTWAIWMSAFIVIYAATEQELPVSSATMLSTRSISILKEISLRGSVWPTACAAAVRELMGRLDQLQPQKKRPMPPTTPDNQASIFPPVPSMNAGDQSSNSTDDIFRDDSRFGRCSSGWTADHWSSAPLQGLGNENGGLSPGLQPFNYPSWIPTENQSTASLFDGFEIPFWMGEEDMNVAWVDDW